MKVVLTRIVATVLVGMLYACGGGSSQTAGAQTSSTTTPANTPVVIFETSSVSTSYLEGNEAGAMMVSFKTDKPLDAVPSVRFAVTGQGLDPRISVSLIDSGATINLRAASGLPPGTYKGEASIHVCLDVQCKQEFQGAPKTLSYTVIVLSHISSPVASVSMASAENSVGETSYILTILPMSGGVTMDAVPDDAASNWLKAEAISGNVFRLTASAATLRTGLYQGSVNVTTRDGLQALSVPVSLVVNTGMLVPPVHATTLSAASNESETYGSVTVGASPGVQFDWRAASATPWIKIDRGSGKAGEQVSWHLDLAAINLLANRASHEGLISIESESGNVSGAHIRVVLNKKLPEVLAVAPYAVSADVLNTIYLRGSGFNAIENLASSVRVGGIAPTSVRRINDTSLVLTMPGMSAGNYAVKTHKLDALSPLTQFFKVVAPRAYSYTAVATTNVFGSPAGAPTALMYDPIRQMLTMHFAIDRDNYYPYSQTALAQFRWNGVQWLSKIMPTPGVLLGLGLTADGNSLIAQSRIDPYTRNVLLFDVETLAQSDQFPVPLVLSTGFNSLLKVTNDNRVLGHEPYSSRSSFDFVDLSSKTTGRYEIAAGQNLNNSWSYDVQGAGISADGEHVIYNGSYREESTAVPLSLDASEGRLRLSAFQPFRKNSIPELNRDGSRVFLRDQVFDGSGKLLGAWDIADALGSDWTYIQEAKSADGLRSYVLAYAASVVADYKEPTVLSTLPKPRIHVFDLSKPGMDGKFPVLGYFELNDYPGCRTRPHLGGSTCPGEVQMVISPDQKTVFMVGLRNLVVAPIPAGLTRN